MTFGALPKGLNARSNFNQEVTDVCLDICCESNFQVRLVSVAADGVRLEEKWIMRNMNCFLIVRADFVAVIEKNHNCKNDRYQFSGYLSVMIMGVHMVDAGLFRVAGVPK